MSTSFYQQNPASRGGSSRKASPAGITARNSSIRTTKADPAEFGKKTSPMRERMAKAIKDTSPEERIRQGR